MRICYAFFAAKIVLESAFGDLTFISTRFFSAVETLIPFNNSRSRWIVGAKVDN